MEKQDVMRECVGGGKTCTRCGRTLPIENFGTHSRYGVKHVCKECEHVSRSNGAKSRGKGALGKFSKEELVAELQRRGYKLMADPTPRELMLRLKAMGYDGDITIQRTETINIGKLE